MFEGLEPRSVLLCEEFTLVIKVLRFILDLRQSAVGEFLCLFGVWRKFCPRLFHFCTECCGRLFCVIFECSGKNRQEGLSSLCTVCDDEDQIPVCQFI